MHLGSGLVNDKQGGKKPIKLFFLFFLRRPNLFAICNNTFSKWWESVKDG
jgi:hypothetical protein